MFQPGFFELSLFFLTGMLKMLSMPGMATIMMATDYELNFPVEGDLQCEAVVVTCRDPVVVVAVAEVRPLVALSTEFWFQVKIGVF